MAQSGLNASHCATWREQSIGGSLTCPKSVAHGFTCGSPQVGEVDAGNDTMTTRSNPSKDFLGHQQRPSPWEMVKVIGID